MQQKVPGTRYESRSLLPIAGDFYAHHIYFCMNTYVAAYHLFPNITTDCILIFNANGAYVSNLGAGGREGTVR